MSTQVLDLHEFLPFSKMPRLNREVVITEKIDGSNAQVCIVPKTPLVSDFEKVRPFIVAENNDHRLLAGSRTRWITPGKTTDNYGFAQWCADNATDLFKLGPGRHFGEWWGRGINRNYGLEDRRFSLFNSLRWQPEPVFSDDLGVHFDPTKPGVWREELVGATLVKGKHEGGELCSVSGPSCCHVVPTIWRGNFDTFDPVALVEMLRSHGSFAAPGFMNPEGLVIYHTAAGHGFKVTLEGDESPKSLLTSAQA